jgi:hypothetical protein
VAYLVYLELTSLADITDKFDFTFLCGDLNFRLDITRLHADWLISRKGIYIYWFDSISFSVGNDIQTMHKPLHSTS